MTQSKPSEHEIAAKKSFKNTQFKKGQSGNPHGRPKRKLNERRLRDEKVLSRLEALAAFVAEDAKDEFARFLVSVAAKTR
jgi:hypothetical protein